MIEESKKSGVIVRIAYVYLTLPILIFIAGWFRLYLAIPAILIVLGALFFAMRHVRELWIPNLTRGNVMTVGVILAAALVWLYFSGIGGYAYQNYDFGWRNGIFKTLVENKWPVILDQTAPYFNSPAAFVYYFAFWLPAALIGKAFGLAAGIHFQFIWALIGILLVFYFIMAARERLSLMPVFVFIFFSGLDALGSFLLTNSGSFLWFGTGHIENWVPGFQYSSFTTQLFWVFNQAIPAWLITLLLFHEKDNRSVVFLYSLSLLSCTLPAVGLLPLLCYSIIANLLRDYDREKAFGKNLKNMLRGLFTFTNIAGGGLIGITSFLFLKTNTAGQKIGTVFGKSSLASYLLFVFFEFLIYFIVIYRARPKGGLYWVTLASLLLIPLIRVGGSIDFVMRASIPALVLLCLMTIGALDRYKAEGTKPRYFLLIAIILIGALTAQHELTRSVQRTVGAGADKSNILCEPLDLVGDPLRNNFFGNPENSFFFRHIAKK